MTKTDNDMIDDLFGLARGENPAPSDALMARVLADAASAHAAPQPAPVQSSLWQGILDFVGGWPSVGGLAVAGVTGIWVGFAPPTLVSSWTAELIGTPVTIDMLSDTSGFFAEGQADG